MWRWARISLAGQRFLGIYGQDEYGWVFHAVLDLSAISDDQIGGAAASVRYAAFAMWRLGPHESISVDERLPAQVQAFNRASYDRATPEQTIVLIMPAHEVMDYALPPMTDR